MWADRKWLATVVRKITPHTQTEYMIMFWFLPVKSFYMSMCFKVWESLILSVHNLYNETKKPNIL